MASGAVTTKTIYGTAQTNTIMFSPASSKSMFVWNCIITNTEAGTTRLRFASTRKAITGATQADPCQLTITGHGYSVDDEILIDEIVGMVELNGNTYKVKAVVDANNITIKDLADVDVDSTGFTAYTSGGNSYVGDGIATLDGIGVIGLNGINMEGEVDDDVEVTCPANTTVITLTDDLS